MPLIPPKTTRVRAPALGNGDDSTTTRVQDTTGNALDRLLKFINTTFVQANNALTVLLPVALSKGVNGPLAVTGAITGASYSGGPIKGTTGTFSGAVTGTSYSGGVVSGTNASFGGTGQFAGGVTTGSRFCGFRGFVESNAIAGSVSNVQFRAIENNGGTIAQVGTFYSTPYAGSIAAISLKVYNFSATAGTAFSITSVGATTNISNAYSFTQVNATVYQTFAPGAYPYPANSQLSFLATTLGWAQGGGGVDLQVWFYE